MRDHAALGLLPPAEQAEADEQRTGPHATPDWAWDWPMNDPEEQSAGRRSFWLLRLPAMEFTGSFTNTYLNRLREWAEGAR